MPTQPSLDSIRTINPVLTTFSHKVHVNPAHVMQLAFPIVPVDLRKGKIIRFNDDEDVLLPMRRAPGARILEVSGGWGSDDYSLYQDAISEVIPIEHLQEANASVPSVNMEQQAIERARYRSDLRLEYDRAQLLSNSGQYPAGYSLNLSGDDQWSSANCDILAKVDEYNELLIDGCGMPANTMILSHHVFNVAKRNPNIRAQLNPTTRENLSLASLLGMLNIPRGGISAGSYRLPNVDGRTKFFDNKVWLGYVDPESQGAIAAEGSLNPPMTSEPMIGANNARMSFGYTYQLRGYPIARPRVWDDDTESYKYPYLAEHRPVMTGLKCGILLNNVVA